MRPILVLSALIVAAAVSPAPAQPPDTTETQRGTEQERAACTPDVFRLCAWYIPNVPNIVVCLKQQTPNLSPACRVVFEKGNPSPTDRSARAPRSRPQTEGSGGLY